VNLSEHNQFQLKIRLFNKIAFTCIFMTAFLWAMAGALFAGAIDSPLYRKYIQIPENDRNSIPAVIAAMKAEIKSDTVEVEAYVVLAIAELAGGDVEDFVRNINKANKKRYYKFKPHPLSKYQPFVNKFVNLLRTVREINNRFEAYPTSSMLRYQFALLCREYDKVLAIEYLKKALSLYGDFLDARLKLAELYEECMDYNRAIEQWRVIMDLRPYDFRPYYKICHLSSKMGNFTIAEGIYGLGQRKKMTLHEHKEFQQVIEDLVADFPRLREERSITAEKLINIDALLDVAETYLNTICDIRQAEQACVKAVHIDQMSYKPHLLYAKILDILGETAKSYEEMLFVAMEGGDKIKDAYLTEIVDLCERKLISDMLQNNLKISDMINYFSIYYQ